MEMVSGTSTCTKLTWSRFQSGSKSRLAKRSARMLSIDSLPRKWSIRKTWVSSKVALMTSLRRRADSKSTPKGFSKMTRARSRSPDSPSSPTMGTTASGGIARCRRRRTSPPIAASASATAPTRAS